MSRALIFFVFKMTLVEQLEGIADRQSDFISEYAKMYVKWYGEVLEPYSAL